MEPVRTTNGPGSGAARPRGLETLRGRADIHLPVEADTDIMAVRDRGWAFARLQGLSSGEATVVATAISELAREIRGHARVGEIIVAAAHDAGRQGIAITAREAERGLIAHPASLARRLLDVGTAGCRIDEVRRLMDEFEIVAEVGKGTVVTATKWKA